MRDAAGKLADRLHLLALRDLHLERALLGRIDGVGDGRLALALALLDGAQIDPAAAVAVAGKGDIDRLDQALAASAASSARRSAGWLSGSTSNSSLTFLPSSAAPNNRMKAELVALIRPSPSTVAMAMGEE